MKKTVLHKNIILALAVGGMAAAGSAHAANVAYNTTSNLTPNGLRTADGAGADPTTWKGGTNPAYNVEVPNYAGGLPATWYTSLMATDSSTIKTSEMPADMGIAKLSVGGKAYQDVTPAPLKGNGTVNPDAPATNWGHNSDFGLFHLQSFTQSLTITVSADGSQLSPGFSVWSGWDNGSGSSRHASWLSNGAPGLKAGSPGVLASSLGQFEGTAYTGTSGGSAILTLTNLPAGDYSLILGGFSDGRTCPANQKSACTASIGGLGGLDAQYKVSFTATSMVPVPGAAWLFGSALLGMVGYKRRKIG